jgi:hypothetical protein
MVHPPPPSSSSWPSSLAATAIEFGIGDVRCSFGRRSRRTLSPTRRRTKNAAAAAAPNKHGDGAKGVQVHRGVKRRRSRAIASRRSCDTSISMRSVVLLPRHRVCRRAGAGLCVVRSLLVDCRGDDFVRICGLFLPFLLRIKFLKMSKPPFSKNYKFNFRKILRKISRRE